MVDFGLSKDSLRNIVSLTGEFVGTTDTLTLTNKTISLSSNSLTATSGALGDLIAHDGTSYVRKAKGTANQAYVTNSGATDTGWGTVAVQGGGTGVATFGAGGVLIGSGTSAITTKANPTGAFLGDSDTQNVTGAKTFSNTTLKKRNPAGTFTLTEVHPAITSDQDTRANEQYAYYIFKDGSTYYAKSGITKGIEFSGSVADVVIQSAVTAVLASSRGGMIRFSADDFPLNTAIDIPTSTTPKPLVLKGTRTQNRVHGTVFSATTSFPTNRYMFETSGCTDLSLKYASVYIEDLAAYNINFATRNVGFLKYESDNNVPRMVMVQNVYTQYIWRPIHLIGVVWWGIFGNIHFEDLNSAFTGDADIIMEQGSHTNVAINSWPKSNVFRDMFAVHSGTQAGGGSMNTSLDAIDAGYNLFDNYFVDSNSIFNEAIFSFTGKASSNIMTNTIVLDTNQTPSPDNRFGCLYLSGTNCYDNRFFNSRLTDYRYMVAFKSGAYRNQVEIAGQWGSNLDIDDTAGGVDNAITIFPGSLAAATPFSKPTTTGAAGLTKIIDERKGAYNTGSAATITTGNTSVAVTHGLFTTPLKVRLSPTSDTLGKRWWVSAKGATTFTISIDSSGGSNITFDWEADVY